MTMQNNFGAFDDFFSTMLETDPQLAYMGAASSQPYRGTGPMQQRAREYWTDQYKDVYGQFQGVRANELRQRKDPSQWTTFTDYLESFPFTQRYSALTPYQRGEGISRFAPSTRHIYF